MPIYVTFSAPISNSCEAESAQLIHSSMTAAPGGLRTRSQPDDITFTKKTDFLSAKLMAHAAKGTEFEAIAIELRKQGSPTPYLIYKLSNVLISGYQFAGGTSVPYETISLTATSVSWRYFS